MNTTLDTILQSKVIAIVRGIPGEKIVELAKAISRGGIRCIEVTFDQTTDGTQTLEAIRALKAQLGDEVCVGAGTVMTAQQVIRAAEAGAEYMISPNTDEAVIRQTKQLGKISIPGAMTPSEAVFAHSCGADIVKLFPAGILGASYIKAVKAPLKHIPVVAVGGINAENCRQFIEAGAVGVGVGGNLVDLKLVEEGRLDEITQIAQAYTNALHG